MAKNKQLNSAQKKVNQLFIQEIAEFASIHVQLESFFSDMSLKTIKNAGHWVHADAPEEFTNTVLEFCLR